MKTKKDYIIGAKVIGVFPGYIYIYNKRVVRDGIRYDDFIAINHKIKKQCCVRLKRGVGKEQMERCIRQAFHKVRLF